jgi:PKHD-type hydroxylase
MILCIGNVLDAKALAALRDLIERQTFASGSATAGWAARTVKNNEQLPADASGYPEIRERIGKALGANELFALAAAPKCMRPIMISRYGPGMGYGTHVDNALMGDADKMRSDVSFTLFLSDPDSYEGGDLVIDDVSGESSYKLPAGAMVLYPSTTLHRVENVSKGERLVALGWVQSLVRDASRRAMLFDLETVRREMFAKDGKTPHFDTLSKCASNLWRMWADP